jgi:MraZ protein
MFLGRFYHNFDNKGRLTIPSRFRELLTVEPAYIVQGFDPNLMVLPSSIFESWSYEIAKLSVTNPAARMLQRMLNSSATQVEIDKTGRMLIPQFLRTIANLQEDAVITGNRNFFEIWSPEQWAVQEEKLQDEKLKAELFSVFNITTG